MRTGLFCLVLGYVLSQFYRAFLAVLAPSLLADIGAGPDDLARASGLWFLAFAVMQLPVGWALDRFGPGMTSAVLLAVGGGGAALFAMAQSAAAIDVAMILIGVGCAPILMAAYYIFARAYPPVMFGTLAGVIVGLGSLGNIASALPLAWAVETFGWRETVAGLAVVTLLVALALGRFVPALPAVAQGTARGSVLDLLKMPALWLILPLTLVNYVPAAGVRGLWVGPYLVDVYGVSAADVGMATLIMGLFMIAGSFAYGPLDRVFGTRKWVILTGNLLAAACLFLLWLFPMPGYWTTIVLLSALGLVGASFPAIIAHGRSFVPAHMMGRGVTLLNLFSIGGAGLIQMLSGPVHSGVTASGGVVAGYQAIFLFFALMLLAGCVIYFFCEDRTD